MEIISALLEWIMDDVWQLHLQASPVLKETFESLSGTSQEQEDRNFKCVTGWASKLAKSPSIKPWGVQQIGWTFHICWNPRWRCSSGVWAAQTPAASDFPWSHSSCHAGVMIETLNAELAEWAASSSSGTSDMIWKCAPDYTPKVTFSALPWHPGCHPRAITL